MKVVLGGSLSLLVLLGLAACGGGGSDNNLDNMPRAFTEFGQPDFTSFQPNAGQGTVNNLGLGAPQGGVATDGTHFYVADYSNSRILGWNNIPTGASDAPDFVLGQPDFSNNAPATARGSLALPASVWIEPTDPHRLVVADSGNNRVLIWNTLPTSTGALPDVVVGQADFTSSAAPTTPSATSLNKPVYAAIAHGKLFVTDQSNNRVLIWNTVPSSSGAAADVVLGQSDFTKKTPAIDPNTGLTSTQTPSGMTQPAGLWTDGFRLLVCDNGDNRVLFWSQIPTVSGSQADNVIGQIDFSRVTSGVSATNLFNPFGVSSDGTQVFIADASNNRVVRFPSFPIANASTAIDQFGQNTLAARAPNDDDQNGTADDNPTDRTLNGPTGVTVFSGVVYVTDRNNHRIMFFPQTD